MRTTLVANKQWHSSDSFDLSQGESQGEAPHGAPIALSGSYLINGSASASLLTARASASASQGSRMWSQMTAGASGAALSGDAADAGAGLAVHAGHGTQAAQATVPAPCSPPPATYAPRAGSRGDPTGRFPTRSQPTRQAAQRRLAVTPEDYDCSDAY